MTNEAYAMNDLWPRDVSIADASRGKKRLVSFDVIRAVTILVIIVEHTPLVPTDGPFNTFIWSLIECFVSLFFMLSGALLLPVNGAYSRFLGRRLIRVVLPFLVWSAIYILMEYFAGDATPYWTIHRLKWMWLMTTFSAGWFVPVMVCIYLMMPVVSPWIARATGKQLLYFLGLWAFAGLAPWLSIFCRFNPTDTFFGLFANYFGYAVAGYCVSRFVLSGPKVWKPVVGVCVVAGILFPLYAVYNPGHQDVMPIVTHSLSFTSMGAATLFFVALGSVRRLGRVLEGIVRAISANVYGMYLSHFFVMDYIVRPYFPAIDRSSVLFPVVTAAISFMLSWLLSRLKLTRMIFT